MWDRRIRDTHTHTAGDPVVCVWVWVLMMECYCGTVP